MYDMPRYRGIIRVNRAGTVGDYSVYQCSPPDGNFTGVSLRGWEPGVGVSRKVERLLCVIGTRQNSYPTAFNVTPCLDNVRDTITVPLPSPTTTPRLITCFENVYFQCVPRRLGSKENCVCLSQFSGTGFSRKTAVLQCDTLRFGCFK